MNTTLSDVRANAHVAETAPLRTIRGGHRVPYRRVRRSDKLAWQREAQYDAQTAVTRGGTR